MPKIKFEAKKTQKMNIEPEDLARAIVESWSAMDIADLLTDIMDEVGTEGKESQVINYINSFGYKPHLEAWAKGFPY